MNKQPVFILAGSPRTGSTWLQRVLTSTGEILIWGETGLLFHWGVLWTPNKPSQEFCFEGRNYKESHEDKDLYAFREKKADMWMAVLAPLLSDAFKAHKSYLEELFGETAKREGFPNWGAKETTWGECTAKFLVQSSGGKVIFLFRKFEDSFISRFSGAVQHCSHEYDLKDWCDRWIKQHTYALSYIGKENVKFVHYENLCDDKNALLDLLRWAGCKNPPDHSQCDRMISRHPLRGTISDEDTALILPYREKIDTLTKKIEML